MKLSAPVYVLKSQAKDLKKARKIPLSEALDEVAKKEGYATWSLLISKHQNELPNKFCEVLDFLNPGDLVLVAARPKQGKSIFAAGLVSMASESGRPISHLFTVLEREQDSERRIGVYTGSGKAKSDICIIDSADDISADYIVSRVAKNISPGALIVIDYLQLMDEKRINPPVQQQIETLVAFAKQSGCIFILLAQVDPQIDGRVNQEPGLKDIRFPNPLDLNLFNKIIFLHRDRKDDSQIQVSLAGKNKHRFAVGLDKSRACIVDVA
jgi:replicative DNA helicase